jgi:exosortase
MMDEVLSQSHHPTNGPGGFMTASNPTARSVRLSPLAALAGLALAIFLWAYWPTLGAMAEKWSHDPNYSHGFLVPGFALAVLWFRRHRLSPELLRPSAWGLPLLLAGGAIRLAGAYFFFPWLDTVSLLPSLAGLCLLLGGPHALLWAWPALAFLVFMMPLPYMAEVAMAHPLQRFATLSSTYLLQTVGFPAWAEGNIIVLNQERIGVVEACNGLSMLVVFFAVATACAFVLKRPLWEKGLVVLSAVPIALIANVVRITLTGVLTETTGREVGQAIFHDWGGWLMMPLALLLLWAELRLLSWLLVNPAAGAPVPVVLAGLPQARPRADRRPKPKKRQRRPHGRTSASVQPTT